ncbi:MAG: HAMP domain-containing protein [Burkholderiales bacterium]|nr:HAMP domain-containing protein [Burkholderiales bacterium]
MQSKTLKFKVVFYLAVALTLAMLIFIALVVRHQRDELLREAIEHVGQISDVIKKSTHFAMLANQPTYVDSIIKDVGSHGNLEKVRILAKDGTIIHSTYQAELGSTVDRKAEGCVLCHRSDAPLEPIPQTQRTRLFSTPDGRPRLGAMDVIRNEPSCYTANCHVHSKAQSVLGVLDIVYSLDDLDRKMRINAINMVLLSIGFIIIAALSVGFFVHRLVYVPLRDLEAGARRLSSGNLDETIPVRSQDEFGQLAGSFNSMTVALRNSQAELREWGHTLEQKVEKRTQELRIAEAETARTEKLASVGLLAAGIAHELNNPLTGVLTFTTLLRKKMPEGTPDAEDLDLVIRETKRCATIIRRLLDFAREKTPEKSFADLNQVIEDTARIVERPASFRDIEIAMNLDPNLPQVWVDADLIKQVIMNMLVNAQHAIEHEGNITVRSRLFPQPRSPEPGMEPVNMVEISVIDTGCGIPEKNLKRIFDPFFTSKEVGKGTGLGLSVSHGIVRAHGGAIEVESVVGSGSTFRIYLPVEPPAGEAQSSRSYQ